MEDEEIQSYASPGSEPHSPPSGRITVTVAAAPPPSLGAPAVAKYASPVMPSNQSSLTLALPIQGSSRPVGGSGGGGGREDCWSEGATSVLIDAWGERYTELSRGNLKQKHWKEVADIVSSREDYAKTPKTDIQCKNRIDTVKKKYKIEKAKVVSGCGPSRWPFFERLDRFLSPSSAASAARIASPATAVATAVGSNSQRGVPVGIPVGVRPLPLPALPHYSPHHHLHMPPHLQSQPPPPPPPPPPQQHFRPNNISPLPMFNKFNNSVNNNANNNANNVNNNNKQLRRGPPPPLPLDSESDPEEGWSQDSGDSLPPLERRKRPKVELNSLGGQVNMGKGKGKRKREKAMGVWGNSVRELTRAILKFGEAYEVAESSKLQQIVEMEKQRMKFAKELELQRMKFLMKTQLELSQLNDDGSNNSDTRAGGSSGRAGGGGGGGGNHHNHHDNHLSHAISDASD